MSDQLTDNLHNLNSWMNSRNLFLSPEKSRAIIFTKSGSIRSPPPPVMSGSTPIPWTTEHKYLGLHIESNLRWRKHVEMITGKISMANNIVKALCGKTWGAHPSVLMGVYKVLAVPHFDYGCLVYGRCSRELIERRFPEHTLAFTDASVSRAPDSVGYGVFFPSMAVELSGRLPDHWSIFDAELFAIGKAVSEASERKLRRLLVVSDSLSALEALKSNKFDSSVDIISMRVRNTLYVANSTGCAVSCIWVPSHSYIHANDVADRLANQGRYADTAPHIPGGPQTLWPRIKRDIRGSWIEDFLKSCISRGRIYSLYVNHHNFPLSPWFSKIDKPRRFLIAVLRLKSGHCLTPAHLHRIGVRDSPNCDCGALGDIPHIFLSCEKHVVRTKLLYDKLSVLDFPLPLNIYDAIFSTKLEVLELLMQFVRECGLTL
ncbi:uncharacterized protein LOC123317016 isoform X3 [Coccinella septempunctata]|uniref:uncharacterized protein LOC123317016 isoform X3 n=1 Tax=Coccinella septempunctata TaxID=41139 RepID=UPI001D062E77|nr:uncharacterized protein LOC123317016 isoform X3 [Coccinella septempunctata]